jgi:hypothetical protein
MREPVMVDNHPQNYEFEVVKSWLRTCHCLDIIKGRTLTSLKITSNTALANEISQFLQAHPDIDEREVYFPSSWMEEFEYAIRDNDINKLHKLIRLDFRLLKRSMSNGYAFHLTCEYAKLETALYFCLYHPLHIMRIASLPIPAHWQPKHLRELIAHPLLKQQPDVICALQKLESKIYRISSCAVNDCGAGIGSTILASSLEAPANAVTSRSNLPSYVSINNLLSNVMPTSLPNSFATANKPNEQIIVGANSQYQSDFYSTVKTIDVVSQGIYRRIEEGVCTVVSGNAQTQQVSNNPV